VSYGENYGWVGLDKGCDGAWKSLKSGFFPQKEWPPWLFFITPEMAVHINIHTDICTYSLKKAIKH